MIYSVLIDGKGNIIGCIEGSAGQADGEIYLNVFTGGASVYAEADEPDKAIKKAKGLFEKYKAFEKRRSK